VQRQAGTARRFSAPVHADRLAFRRQPAPLVQARRACERAVPRARRRPARSPRPVGQPTAPGRRTRRHAAGEVPRDQARRSLRRTAAPHRRPTREDDPRARIRDHLTAGEPADAVRDDHRSVDRQWVVWSESVAMPHEKVRLHDRTLPGRDRDWHERPGAPSAEHNHDCVSGRRRGRDAHLVCNPADDPRRGLGATDVRDRHGRGGAVPQRDGDRIAASRQASETRRRIAPETAPRPSLEVDRGRERSHDPGMVHGRRAG